VQDPSFFLAPDGPPLELGSTKFMPFDNFETL